MDKETMKRYMVLQAVVQGELASQDVKHESHGGKGTGVVTVDSFDAFAERCWKLTRAIVARDPHP